jgi:hypothetical protein
MKPYKSLVRNSHQKDIDLNSHFVVDGEGKGYRSTKKMQLTGLFHD